MCCKYRVFNNFIKAQVIERKQVAGLTKGVVNGPKAAARAQSMGHNTQHNRRGWRREEPHMSSRVSHVTWCAAPEGGWKGGFSIRDYCMSHAGWQECLKTNKLAGNFTVDLLSESYKSKKPLDANMQMKIESSGYEIPLFPYSGDNREHLQTISVVVNGGINLLRSYFTVSIREDQRREIEMKLNMK